MHVKNCDIVLFRCHVKKFFALHKSHEKWKNKINKKE